MRIDVKYVIEKTFENFAITFVALFIWSLVMNFSQMAAENFTEISQCFIGIMIVAAEIVVLMSSLVPEENEEE